MAFPSSPSNGQTHQINNQTYQYNGSGWKVIGGPTGPVGPQGVQGNTGSTGPVGPAWTGGTVPNNTTFNGELYYNSWLRSNDTEGLYWAANGWHVYSQDGDDFRMRAGSGSCGIKLTVGDDTARGYLYADTGNDIGFLTNGRSWALRMDSSKNCYVWGNVTAYSDRRHKKDVSTIEDGLEKVNKLRGVDFTRIDTDQKSSGVIAQELQEVMPQLVHEDSNGELSVAYGNITGVLIEAIKELTAKVEALENK
jgi:hypothetical protein